MVCVRLILGLFGKVLSIVTILRGRYIKGPLSLETPMLCTLQATLGERGGNLERLGTPEINTVHGLNFSFHGFP